MKLSQAALESALTMELANGVLWKALKASLTCLCRYGELILEGQALSEWLPAFADTVYFIISLLWTLRRPEGKTTDNNSLKNEKGGSFLVSKVNKATTWEDVHAPITDGHFDQLTTPLLPGVITCEKNQYVEQSASFNAITLPCRDCETHQMMSTHTTHTHTNHTHFVSKLKCLLWIIKSALCFATIHSDYIWAERGDAVCLVYSRLKIKEALAASGFKLSERGRCINQMMLCVLIIFHMTVEQAGVLSRVKLWWTALQ